MQLRKSTATALALLAVVFLATWTCAAEDKGGSALRRAADPVAALMADERWERAAAILDEALKDAPNDHNLHLRRGRCALGLMDLPAAGKHFSRAISLAPGIESEVAKSWKSAALTALDSGRLDRAVAMFAKAFYLDRELGPEIGRLTIEAAQDADDEAKRAGYMTRAVAWAGTRPVMEASIAHYSKAFGPPRKVYLDNPGWAEVARLRPGDELLYLSEHPFKQRDAATLRIVPAAVTQPMKLTIEERDTKGEPDTLVSVARHRLPTQAFIWLIPGSLK